MKIINGVDALDDFIIESVNNNKVILLYFGASWCGPCKQLKKKLEDSETQKSMPNLVVAYMDTDVEDNNNLVNRYNVSSLPTLVFIKLEENKVVPVSRVEGYDFTKLKLEYDKYQ